jgi:peptidoglycan/xylan/chitin deacetylase (PgdA/CDA1 family)
MLRLSCDDGCKSDLRVADLCSKYEIECTFYWPVEWRSLAYDNGYEPLDIVEALSIAQRYEIGSHTVTHRHLTKLTTREAEIEILDSKFMLEALFDKKVNKFCPPRGYTNKELTEYTLMVYSSQRLTKGKGLVHVHPDSGANGNVPWRDYANKIEVEELWCHSWELDKYNLWDELEEYLREVTHC